MNMVIAFAWVIFAVIVLWVALQRYLDVDSAQPRRRGPRRTASPTIIPDRRARAAAPTVADETAAGAQGAAAPAASGRAPAMRSAQ